MTDPYKTNPFGDRQSKAVLSEAKEGRGGKATTEAKTKPPQKKSSKLYEEGVALFKGRGIHLELSNEGSHVYHKIWIPDRPKPLEGIKCPDAFLPQREMYSMEDFRLLETVLEQAPTDVKDFWLPLVQPKSGDSDLQAFSERKLKMKAVQDSRDFYEVLDYQHTFDPSGSLTGNPPALHPRSWVPAREWFSEVLHSVTFEDVFTLFPYAENQLLKLLLGRVGVGRSGHLPPSFTEPVEHTARMAAVIIGNDPGLEALAGV